MVTQLPVMNETTMMIWVIIVQIRPDYCDAAAVAGATRHIHHHQSRL